MLQKSSQSLADHPRGVAKSAVINQEESRTKVLFSFSMLTATVTEDLLIEMMKVLRIVFEMLRSSHTRV